MPIVRLKDKSNDGDEEPTSRCSAKEMMHATSSNSDPIQFHTFQNEKNRAFIENGSDDQSV